MKKIFLYNSFFFLLTWLVICCSCSSQKTKADLVSYINNPENGCFFVDSVNDFKIEVKYKPIDLLIANEVKYKKLDKQQTELLKKSYGDFIHFTINLYWRKGDFLNNALDYEGINNILTNRLSDYIMITENKDTIGLADSFFPKLYEMSHKTSFMVSFNSERLKNSKEFNLVIRKGLLPQKISFKIKTKDLEKVNQNI